MQDDPTTTEAPATTSIEEPKKSNSSESINKSSKESTTESGQTTDDEVRRGNYAGTDIDSDMEYTTKKIRAGTIMENLEPPMTLRPKPKSKGTPKVAEEIDYQTKLMGEFFITGVYDNFGSCISIHIHISQILYMRKYVSVFVCLLSLDDQTAKPITRKPRMGAAL